MLTYFLLIAAVALFVWGLMLIIQGWYGTADEIVPLTDLEEIKDLGVKIPAPILKPTPAVSIPPGEPPNPPNTALLEEYQKKLRALEEEKNALEAKIEENSRLEKNFEEQKAKLEQMGQELKTAQQERDHLQKESQSQIKVLEDRLKEAVDTSKKEMEGFQSDAERKRLEAERLQKELLTVREESQARHAQWGEAIARLKAETEELSRQRQEKEEALKEVKDRLELMQKTNNQRLNEAHHTIDLLRIQKEESDRLREETLAKELAQLSATAESLTKEKENLLRVNNRLAEKEKMLQHELTKSRAQALGLEKICEEFKVQIEEMSRAAVAKV